MTTAPFHAPQVIVAPNVPVPTPSAPTAVDLDDMEGEQSFKLNAQSRAALMNRLASSAGLAPAAAAALPPPPGTSQGAMPAPGLAVEAVVLMDQGLLGPASPIPTNCLLLKNMFNPLDPANEPGWQAEVVEDVKDECGKYGALQHCHLDPNSKVRGGGCGGSNRWVGSRMGLRDCCCWLD